MIDLIDEAFADLDQFYPGSRRKRRQRAPSASAPDSLGWDHSPIVRTLAGRPVDMFQVGALAEALTRPVVTIRTWERKGYIPTAPYRWRSGVGGKQAGKRLYSRSIIQSTVDAFRAHGVLDARRIDWEQSTALSIQLFEEWKSIHLRETTA